jgi:hypothetical protein
VDTSDNDPTDAGATGRDYSGSTTTADNGIGTPRVAAREMAWAQFRARYAELPPVVTVLGRRIGTGHRPT